MVGIVINSNASSIRALTGACAAVVKTPVKAEPQIQGPHGKAWLCEEAQGLREMNIDPANSASLAHWVIEAPWAHPAWHSYSLILVHLRPMPDKRETLIYLDDATHEIFLHALDAGADREALIGTGICKDFLTPTNFAAQFIEIADPLARDRVAAAVQMVCDGKLSPDTDFTSQWAGLFGDNMLKDRINRRPPRRR